MSGHGATLADRLVAAQAAMRQVGRDATNNFHKYRYVSSERMIEECRQALTTAGLAFMRTGWSVNAETHVLTAHFHLSAGGCESLTWTADWPVIEDKGRPYDKALAGALTTSLAYVLRDLLLVSKADEDEVDARDDREHKADVLGPNGAALLHRRLAAANLEIGQLSQAIAAAEGGPPPLDVARWPRAWEPRIRAWMTRNAPAKDAPKESTP